jgi:hypothetical protein
MNKFAAFLTILAGGATIWITATNKWQYVNAFFFQQAKP